MSWSITFPKILKGLLLLVVMMLIIILVLFITKTAFTEDVTCLQEIPALGKEGCQIRNKEQLLGKIQKIVADGPNRLQIVTDFDNTLTADKGMDGKPVLNSFEMFRKCPSVPMSYKSEEYKLYLKYKSVENDPTMSIEDKSKQLNEWYQAAFGLMKGLKFPRKELMDIARNFTGSFRTGIRELVTWTEAKKVRIVVLSSGLGDAVADCLEAANFLAPQLTVISNFLNKDHDDIIIGFMPLNPIHSFNKNEYFIEDKHRSNIILMGDSTGDANMVDKMDNNGAVIKIGYLSEGRQSRLAEYLKIFDIVSINDHSLDVINDILKLL